MRYLPARALLVAVALLLTVPISVQAYHGGAETVYVTPTESVLTVPTSYVVPTSYLWPTSYVSPTVYTTSYLTSTYYLSPTAYVVPTYSATGYYVPRRLGRSLVPTTRTYYPALTATAWEYPVVATSAIYPASDCSTAGIVSTPLPSSPTLKTTRNGGASERRPSGVVDSVPANEPGLNTDRTSPPNSESAGGSESTTRSGGATSLPIPGPAPEAPGDARAPVPPGNEPQAGGGGQSGGAAGLQGETTRRDVQKPKATDAQIKPVSATRGILEGKVISADSGQLEEGVRLIVTHNLKSFEDRIAMTDALGRYAINLPEGDWTVRVEMPSKKTFPVSKITVSGGRISDDKGHDVPSLTIKR